MTSEAVHALGDQGEVFKAMYTHVVDVCDFKVGELCYICIGIGYAK